MFRLMDPMPYLLSLAPRVLAATPSPHNSPDANLFRSLFLVAFGGTLLLLAIRRLRTYRLRERYALLFVLIGLPFLGLAFWPDGVGWLAEKLKIQYNTLALIGVSVFLFLVVFELLTIVSVQEQKITTLAQLVGILMEKQKLVEREHAPGPLDALRAGPFETLGADPPPLGAGQARSAGIPAQDDTSVSEGPPGRS